MLEDVRVRQSERGGGMGLNRVSNGSNSQIDRWNQMNLGH